MPVFCLTVDANHPDTIWIGTQGIRGVYRSDDGGEHWVEKVNGIVESEGITFRGFTVDPRDPDVVYGAAEISSFAWADTERRGREFDMVKGVVYKTTDGGGHWDAIWRGDNLARYVWLDPRNPDVVYVSTGIFDREAANSDPVSGKPGGVGIIKSTDGGRTWRSMVNGLRNLYVGSLFMHPTNPDILIAGAGNVQYSANQGVYLTTNGGSSWRHTLGDELITAVEFSTSDPRIAYAGGRNSIYRSTDGGRTWRRMTPLEPWGSPGIAAGFPIDFQVDPMNPNRVFANNYGGGNVLSKDGGRTWVNASQGYTGAQVRGIAVDPVHAQKAYCAARSGIFRSTDSGSIWHGTGYPPANQTEYWAVAVDPVGGSHLLAAQNVTGGVFASYDGGASWRATTAFLPWGFAFRTLAFASNDPRVVYAGTGRYLSAGAFWDDLPASGVYVSGDGGQTWRKPIGAFSDAHVAALAVDPLRAARVFAATNYGVLESEDGGLTWARPDDGLPTNPPAAISVAIDPHDRATVLASYNGAGVYRSVDGGVSWTRSVSGLPPEAFISSIVFSLADPSVVFAADRRSGVYRSTDGGVTWSPLGQDLGFRAVNALALSSDGEHLYAATEGGGVYRLDLSGTPPATYKVPPAAALTRPRAIRYAISRSSSFAISGSVSPGHATSGSVLCEKYVAGRWKTVAAYTRSWISPVSGSYRVIYRLPAGRYRFRATHGSSASTSCHLRGLSAFSRAVTVK